MYLVVNGVEAFVGTGGRKFDPALPLVVFVHGAGLDHTVWALLTRWLAHHGCGVLAPDLPGHGHSGGEPLASIGAIADWIAALIEASKADRASIIGHSMGSLVAIETAARHPTKVNAIVLIGPAAAMPVSPELLDAAKADNHAAIDKMSIWDMGFEPVSRLAWGPWTGAPNACSSGPGQECCSRISAPATIIAMGSPLPQRWRCRQPSSWASGT
jgi:pimeloyl-ACP methyl ester carboxylesterase